ARMAVGAQLPILRLIRVPRGTVAAERTGFRRHFRLRAFAYNGMYSGCSAENTQARADLLLGSGSMARESGSNRRRAFANGAEAREQNRPLDLCALRPGIGAFTRVRRTRRRSRRV